MNYKNMIELATELGKYLIIANISFIKLCNFNFFVYAFINPSFRRKMNLRLTI